MKSDFKFFKKSNYLAIDQFFQNVLYDKNIGYYNTNVPFGNKGDFITSPKISNLFSEIVAIWMIATWEKIGKPKNFNIVELGPGDGELARKMFDVFKKFPEFNSVKKIYLYEISNFLKKVQKKKINDKKIRWISNLNTIKKGPVIFFGNEFFDAIPIKQFKRKKNILLEKFYVKKMNYEIKEVYKKTSKEHAKEINSYRTLKNLRFIEFPKKGFQELKKILKTIKKLEGCILLIDYGYLKSNNQNTLQSVIKHKKNNILNNLGKADVTSHVNFELLNEFFLKNNLNVKKIITQKEFLEKMGIQERAEIISQKMKFTEKSNLYLRLKRLLSPRLMGNLFKVFLAHNLKNNDYFGFR